MEQIKKRAAKFVTGNYCRESGSTKINMDRLGWIPLEERRSQNKLKIFYRARMGLVDIPFGLKESTSKTRRAGSYAIQTSNTDSH